MPSQSTECKKSWHSQTCLVCDRCFALVNYFLNKAIVTTCPGLPYVLQFNIPFSFLSIYSFYFINTDNTKINGRRASFFGLLPPKASWRSREKITTSSRLFSRRRPPSFSRPQGNSRTFISRERVSCTFVPSQIAISPEHTFPAF